jgi:hypothetical protein
MMAGNSQMDAWILTSSNGHTRVVCSRPSADASDGWLFDLLIEYEIPGTPAAAATLAALRLRPAAVVDLLTAIRAFTALPPIHIEPAAFRYSAELSEVTGESLELTFGPLPAVVSESTGIGCLTKLGRGSFGAQAVFRTDTTCLERLADDLDRLLLVDPTT